MIAELLRAKRLENKLTQKQLAEKAKVSFVCINRIEKGQLPRLTIVEKLFTAMGYKITLIAEPNVKQEEIPYSQFV